MFSFYEKVINKSPVIETAIVGFGVSSGIVITVGGDPIFGGDLGVGLFSLPTRGEVTPGIGGKFFGGDLAIGLLRKCIKNDLS